MEPPSMKLQSGILKLREESLLTMELMRILEATDVILMPDPVRDKVRYLAYLFHSRE